VDRGGAFRASESLVVAALVAVEQLVHRVVFGLGRVAGEVTVVGEREERRSGERPAARRERSQPAFGDEIEQCRGRYEMAARKDLRVIERADVVFTRLDVAVERLEGAPQRQQPCALGQE